MNGECIIGFSGFLAITANINVELLEIAYGLKMAWDVGFQDVICEFDSVTTLALVKDGVPKVHPYAKLATHIRKYNSYSWKLVFQHTLREDNACADGLAKHGASSYQAFTT